MKLETDRLILRPFEDGDRDAFATLNADAEVMRWFPVPLDRETSDRMIDICLANTARDGFSFSAVELKSGGFIGMCGLSIPGYETHFTPCIEIGWRFARGAWGNGYATEAARAWLSHGFNNLNLAEIVSFTTVSNKASARVMERIGMTRDPRDDFIHPGIDAGSHIAPHVLYRLQSKDHQP